MWERESERKWKNESWFFHMCVCDDFTCLTFAFHTHSCPSFTISSLRTISSPFLYLDAFAFFICYFLRNNMHMCVVCVCVCVCEGFTNQSATKPALKHSVTFQSLTKGRMHLFVWSLKNHVFANWIWPQISLSQSKLLKCSRFCSKKSHL